MIDINKLEKTRLTSKMKKVDPRKFKVFETSGLHDFYFLKFFNEIYVKIEELKWCQEPYVTYEPAFKEDLNDHPFSILNNIQETGGLPNSREDYIKYFSQFLQFSFNVKAIIDAMVCNITLLESIGYAEVAAVKSKEAVDNYFDENYKDKIQDFESQKKYYSEHAGKSVYQRFSHNITKDINNLILVNIFTYVQMFETFENDLNYFMYKSTNPEEKIKYIHDPLTDYLVGKFKDLINSDKRIRESYDKYNKLTKTDVKMIKFKSLVRIKLIYTLSYLKNFLRDLFGFQTVDTFDEYKNMMFKKNYDDRKYFMNLFFDEIKNMNNAKKIIQDPKLFQDMKIMHLFNNLIVTGFRFTENMADTDDILKKSRKQQYTTLFLNASSFLIYTHNTIKELFLEYNVRNRRFGQSPKSN